LTSAGWSGLFRKKYEFSRLKSKNLGVFWFLVCYAAAQLATQLQVVRSNKVARKRLTESNGTPAMDLGHKNVG